MVSYYTVLMILCWMALIVLCVLVHESSWISHEDKRLFYLTYGIIILSSFAEWLGVQLSGNEAIPVWALETVKCLDYILTPMAGGAIVAQMKLRNRWYKVLIGVLIGNTVWQIATCFNGLMIQIDDHHRYVHGPLYGVYVAIYLAVIVLTAAEFLIFGLAYRKRNRFSTISVFVLLLVGIGMQEVLGGEFRTAYVAMTIGVALMFIHYAEFYKMTADEQLMKDAMCDVYSRYAYMKDIEWYSKMPSLPRAFTVFVFDINGLKTVNDTYGHDAGDELIIGAARCIQKAVGNDGKCCDAYGGREDAGGLCALRGRNEEVVRGKEEVLSEHLSRLCSRKGLSGLDSGGACQKSRPFDVCGEGGILSEPQLRNRKNDTQRN